MNIKKQFENLPLTEDITKYFIINHYKNHPKKL